MQFTINVVQVEKTTKPTAKGSYQQLDVAYKNLESGKLESKKIMSFASKAAFDALANAKQGDSFTVTSEKNDKTGYWDWTSVNQAAPGAQQDTTPQAKFVPTKSTYETPEERAQKQILIVKQSSLSSAVAALTAGAKAPPTPDSVIEVAQKFTDWVFQKPEVKVEKLTDMDDDVPF